MQLKARSYIFIALRAPAGWQGRVCVSGVNAVMKTF